MCCSQTGFRPGNKPGDTGHRAGKGYCRAGSRHGSTKKRQNYRVTRGKIIAVAATVNVSMNEYETATFEDQFITTPMSEAGDSGSLVLNMDNAAVGLLFAGSGKATICNRIKNVMEALSIKF